MRTKLKKKILRVQKGFSVINTSKLIHRCRRLRLINSLFVFINAFYLGAQKYTFNTKSLKSLNVFECACVCMCMCVWISMLCGCVFVFLSFAHPAFLTLLLICPPTTLFSGIERTLDSHDGALTLVSYDGGKGRAISKPISSLSIVVFEKGISLNICMLLWHRLKRENLFFTIFYYFTFSPPSFFFFNQDEFVFLFLFFLSKKWSLQKVSKIFWLSSAARWASLLQIVSTFSRQGNLKGLNYFSNDVCSVAALHLQEEDGSEEVATAHNVSGIRGYWAHANLEGKISSSRILHSEDSEVPRLRRHMLWMDVVCISYWAHIVYFLKPNKYW